MSTFSAPLLWLYNVLKDPVTGVNAMIRTVPHDAPFPAPPAVDLYNSVDDDWVSLSAVPDTIANKGTNAMVVRRVTPTEADVLPVGNGFDAVTYAVHIIARVEAGGMKRSDVALIVDQQLRCARRAITRAMPDFVQQIYPTLNGIEIGIPDSNMFTGLPQMQPIDASLLHDGYVVRLAVHDWFALGLDSTS